MLYFVCLICTKTKVYKQHIAVLRADYVPSYFLATSWTHFVTMKLQDKQKSQEVTTRDFTLQFLYELSNQDPTC